MNQHIQMEIVIVAESKTIQGGRRVKKACSTCIDKGHCSVERLLKYPDNWLTFCSDYRPSPSAVEQGNKKGCEPDEPKEGEVYLKVRFVMDDKNGSTRVLPPSSMGGGHYIISVPTADIIDPTDPAALIEALKIWHADYVGVCESGGTIVAGDGDIIIVIPATKEASDEHQEN